MNLTEELNRLESITTEGELITELYKFISKISSEAIYRKPENMDKPNPVKTTKQLLEALGNPQNSMQVIKIVGTNGKGSSSNFMKNILIENGYKTGLYTSPHIIKFEERVMINNEEIDTLELLKLMKTVYAKGKEIGIEYCGFPIVMTVTAVMYFKQQGVDFAVFEAGVGGKIDPINALTSNYGIVTNVGFDHVHMLGTDIKSIEGHKFGIISEGMTVASPCSSIKEYLVEKGLKDVKFFDTNSSTYEVGGVKAGRLHVKNLSFSDYNYELFKLKMLGEYQIKNLTNVLTIVEALQKNGFEFKNDLTVQGVEKTLVKGRLELYAENLLLDGSHNDLGIDSLITTIKNNFTDKKIKLMISFKKGKDFTKYLEQFKEISEDIYLVDINTFDNRLINDFSEIDTKYLIKNNFTYLNGDCKKSFDLLYSNLKDDEILLVTGSLYLMGEIQKYLKTK